MDNRVCYRCLIRDIAAKDYEEQIGKFLKAIDPKDRTDNDEYETRLTICKACDCLISGTCKACGCYVELRAAGKNAACPHKKW